MHRVRIVRTAVATAAVLSLGALAVVRAHAQRRAADGASRGTDLAYEVVSRQQPPALPEWVTRLEARTEGMPVLPYMSDADFPADRHHRRELLQGASDELQAKAAAELPRLDDPSPYVRAEACRCIAWFAGYASLPDVVEPLARLATSDPQEEPITMDELWPYGVHVPRHGARYPVRVAARAAIEAVWERIDADENLAGVPPEWRKDVLLAYFGTGPHAARQRYAEIELLRMNPDFVTDALAGTNYGNLEIAQNAERLEYRELEQYCGARARDAAILGAVETDKAIAMLKDLLSDPNCVVEPRGGAPRVPPPGWHWPTSADDLVAVYPVRNIAARELTRLGYTVLVNGHTFTASQ